MAMTKSQVKQLQRALRETVMPSIGVDGAWGAQCDQGLAAYAKATGTDTAGATALLQAYATLRFVNDDAFATAAAALSVPESYVRAIAQVETNGDGFLKDGRVKILFERHWFYKDLTAALASSADARTHVAGKLGIATSSTVTQLMVEMVKQQNNICNPERGGYLGNEKEWDRLNLAMDFDVEAGAQSASYGGFQLMGFNFKQCGYPNARSMMIDLAGSESKQFLAVVAFIKANPNLLSAVRAADWAKFAMGYNGSSYKENKYDTKLADAVKSFNSNTALA
jgi:hypothetical protein